MRPSTEFFKKIVGNNPVSIAELGVADGKNAWILYNHFKVKRLWLVDSWCQHYGKNVNDWALSTFKKFDNRRDVVIIKANSVDVADLIPDKSLDYIYIDDLHSAKHVVKELELYLPKVKSDGICAGHDYSPDVEGRVKMGVDSFVEKKGLKLYTEDLDWWFII